MLRCCSLFEDPGNFKELRETVPENSDKNNTNTHTQGGECRGVGGGGGGGEKYREQI